MTEARGWTSRASGNSSLTSGSDRDEASDFECNICIDLAQDPIITLCGHLYCWPCLYRWLRIHSQSQECPVCKALVLEEKLIPLYGRGKTPTDPRSKPIPGLEIPVRPSGVFSSLECPLTWIFECKRVVQISSWIPRFNS